MKTFIKVLISSVTFLLLTSLSVSATGRQIDENISYNYQNNTFSIIDSYRDSESELSLVLLKGQWSVDDLDSLEADDFYYIGQKSSGSYGDFEDMGMKYDNNIIEPGVYTLVTGGEDRSLKTRKIVIGNATDKDGTTSSNVHSGLESAPGIEFGTVENTIRVYNEGTYAYVCIGSFTYTSTGKMGFMFQRQTSGGTVEKAYTELGKLNNPLKNIASMTEGANIKVGLQMNFVPEDVEFVAIPYVSAQ